MRQTDYSADGQVKVEGYPLHSLESEYQAGMVKVSFLIDDIWVEKHTITASDAVAGDSFGYSVAISGDGTTIAVAAPRRDIGRCFNCGVIYVYKYTDGNWVLDDRLRDPDRVSFAMLGNNLSISHDGKTITASYNKNKHTGPGQHTFHRHRVKWHKVRDADNSFLQKLNFG